MKVTTEYGTELEPALQLHLDEGVPVQTYLKAALEFFNEMLMHEKTSAIGYGDKTRFRSYNTEVSPTVLLNRRRGRE